MIVWLVCTDASKRVRLAGEASPYSPTSDGSQREVQWREVVEELIARTMDSVHCRDVSKFEASVSLLNVTKVTGEALAC